MNVEYKKRVGDEMVPIKACKTNLNFCDGKRFYVISIKNYPLDQSVYLIKRDLWNKTNNATKEQIRDLDLDNI